MGSNYFKSGTWNVICDVCGRQYKSDEVMKRWDGLMVCKADFENRHPLDFIRVRNDVHTVPFVRDEGTNTFIGPFASTLPPGDYGVLTGAIVPVPYMYMYTQVVGSVTLYAYTLPNLQLAIDAYHPTVPPCIAGIAVAGLSIAGVI